MQFEEVLPLVAGKPAFTFFAAYALYKLERLSEALASLDSLAASDEGVAHLRAQIVYRMGSYDDAVSAYERMLADLLAAGDADEAEVDDVRLNLAAALVSAGRGGELVTKPDFEELVKAIQRGGAAKSGASFELLYNVGCALLDAGQPGHAMRALEAAYSLGRATLMEEEGMSAAAAAAELANIRAQAAFILQVGHYDDAAAALYSSVITSKPVDPQITTVVTSNLMQIKASARDLVAAYRRLRGVTAATATAPSSKLTRRQVLALLYNKAWVSHALGKGADAAAALNDLSSVMAGVSSDPDDIGGAVSLLTAVVKGAEALTAALDAATSASAAGQGLSSLAAVRVQMLIDAGDFTKAADTLLATVRKNAADAKLHPAVVATAAQLYAAGEDTARGLALIDAAVEAWKKAAAASPSSSASAAQLLHLRATVKASLARDYTAAAADYSAILDLPGVSGHQRAAALACLAMAKSQEHARATAGLSSGAVSSTGGSSVDALVREATVLALGAGGRRPSFVDASKLEAVDVDALESAAARDRDVEATPAKRAAAAAAPAAAAAGGAKKARSARAARRTAAKRAKAKAALLAKLKASGKFDLLGLPVPDPERWLPKRERAAFKKRARKAGPATGKGGSQGVTGGAATEALTASLDAKARADAAKAKGGAGAPAPAAPAAAAAKKGKKGKK